jgi:hypothetical protein
LLKQIKGDINKELQTCRDLPKDYEGEPAAESVLVVVIDLERCISKGGELVST